MNKKIGSVFLVLVLALSASFSAQAQETESFASIWACNFKAGKGVDDLAAWRDFYVDQRGSISSDDARPETSVAWTPRLDGSEFDLIWFDYFENMNAFGRAVEAYSASELGVQIDAAWDSLLDCTNSHHFRRQIYAGGQLNVTQPAVIETFQCRFHPGKSMADVEEALPQWAAVNDRLEGSRAFVAYMFTPLHSSSGFDVSYYGVYDSITDYATATTEYLTSVAGQAMTAQWNEIHRCESSLFNGRIVVPAG